MLAGVLGFIVAVVAIGVFSMVVLRGNTQIVMWLLDDNAMNIVKKEPEEEVIQKIGVYLLTQFVPKDQLITQDMLKKVDFLESIIPHGAVVDMNQVLNKKAIMDLEENTVLSQRFVIEPEIGEIFVDLVEITDIHIPQIVSIGDVVNLRIHFPTGQDYVVLDNKKIEFMDSEQTTFFVSLSEEEILGYSSAREDVLLYPGTLFYLSKESVELTQLPTQESQNQAINYVKYPLNPNALQLSATFSDEFLLSHRKDLDDSLVQFFTQEGSKFSYAINEQLVIPSQQLEAINPKKDAVSIESSSIPNEATTVSDSSAAQNESETITDVKSDDTTTQPINSEFGF